jgi:hypothetical protein
VPVWQMRAVAAWATNADQAAAGTANRGPVTFFESRTCTASGHVATWTQLSPSESL